MHLFKSHKVIRIFLILNIERQVIFVDPGRLVKGILPDKTALLAVLGKSIIRQLTAILIRRIQVKDKDTARIQIIID